MVESRNDVRLVNVLAQLHIYWANHMSVSIFYIWVQPITMIYPPQMINNGCSSYHSSQQMCVQALCQHQNYATSHSIKVVYACGCNQGNLYSSKYTYKISQLLHKMRVLSINTQFIVKAKMIKIWKHHGCKCRIKLTSNLQNQTERYHRTL